jgi:trans-aconitate methyltransferase
MFGHPQGVLGRWGAIIMAHTNADCGAWIAELLEIQPNDSRLEIGFGPGVMIRHLSECAPMDRVVGVDPLPEMLNEARPERHLHHERSRRPAARLGGELAIRRECL